MCQKSYKNAPPVLRSGVPILGNFIGFAKDPVGFVRQSYDQVNFFMLPGTARIVFGL
jgi:hypothetical protein